MANINFISARRAERVRLKKWSGYLTSAVAVVGAGVGAVLLFTVAQLFNLSAEISSTQKEVESLKPIIAKVLDEEKQREALQPQLMTLGQAQGNTERWLGVMDSLKRVMPAQTWLTNVGPDGSGGLRINGMTQDTTRVGETMLRINQQSKFYAGVNLNFVRTNQGEAEKGRPSVEFELAAQLQAPEVKGVENATATK